MHCTNKVYNSSAKVLRRKDIPKVAVRIELISKAMVKINQTKSLKEVGIVGSKDKFTIELVCYGVGVVRASFDRQDAIELRKEIDEWLTESPEIKATS